MKILSIYSLNNFPIPYIAMFTVVIALCIASQVLIGLILEVCIFLPPSSISPHPDPSPLVTTILISFYEFGFFFFFK